nr:uncharacterized protein LOC116284814 isoform X1 [Vicugna pacos]XP_031544634.1 uncharacterized protein LOC116284814 isoform X1 [Vicugna pacos]
MGREHRPGSETPHPLPRSGRRAGRKSLTLTPPPFPLPQRFPSLAPPPLSSLPPQSVGGREPCVTRAVVSPPTAAMWAGPGAGQGAGLKDWREVLLEEEETEGGEVPESKLTLAESVRHDVMEKSLIYKRLAAISVFPGCESVSGMMIGMNAVWLLMASDEQLRAKWMRAATGVLQQRLCAVFMGKQALSRISWKLKGWT